MFRVPIWRMSAYSATMSTWFGSITSVIVGRPVRSRASERYRSASMPRPWNAYGEVRGLNAPPRRTVAPAAATASAVTISCSRLSTEHGPAITVSPPSPMTASSTRITVSSGWNSRDVSLNGREIGVTRSTPASDPNWPISASPALGHLADDRQHRAVRARVLVWREALREDAALHAEDLGFAGARAHDDEHSAVYLPVRMRNKKAEVLRLCHRPTLPAPGHTGIKSCRAAVLEIGSHLRGRTVVHEWGSVNRSGFQAPSS